MTDVPDRSRYEVREGDRVTAVRFATAGGVRTVRCRHLVVADGVRSPVGRLLGRTWHRDTAYGVAARCYLDTTRPDEWISSHLELRGEQGELLSGYGWIFPLGGGLVNLGVGPARLESEGYGEQHPVASNDTEEGRAKNRRIALRVTN